jgi:hypothetical protein
MLTGKVTGTGSEIKVEFTDFTPRKVELRNADSADEMTWVDTMPAGYGLKRLAAGTGSLVTTGGVTPVYQDVLSPPVGESPQDPGRGFLIGTDSDMNVADEIIHWVAYE